MRKNVWLALFMVMILPAMVLTVSCAKKEVATQPEEMAQPEETMAPEEDMEAAQAAEEARMKSEQLRAEAEAMARDNFVNENINFEFDSSALSENAQIILSAKASYMRANPDITVTIEGHCDERGTEAYNMALGERRAKAARDFLVNLGIDEARLSIISYGEERPLDPASNEEAWAKNRRDAFDID